MRTAQRKRLATAIKAAGPRYSPRLNVSLPISSVFDGLGRTPAFFYRIREIQGRVKRAYSGCRPRKDSDAAKAQYQALGETIAPIFSFFRKLANGTGKEIGFLPLQADVERATAATWQCVSELERLERERKATTQPRALIPGGFEGFSSERHSLFQLRTALRALHELCASTDAAAANNPALLLTGVAGTGKTHLFCDVAEQRLGTGLPTFIFLGEEFTSADPWSVIARLLGLSGGVTQLLKTLNDLGKRKRTRTLVMIDALNEAQPRVNWRRLLKARKYQHLAVATSVRSGFESLVLSRSALKEFVRGEHRGFEFREWEAVTKFFTAFKVSLPEVPLLTPEFQNPLFLMLFCRGLRKRQGSNRQAFRGHEGSTYIFEQFVKNGADNIAKELGLPSGRDKQGQYVIWDTVIDRIAEHMARARGFGSRISERSVLSIIEQVSDHLIVRHLLKQHLKDPKRSFRPRSKLGKILSGWNRGLVEALAVQVPERLKGRDLVSVASAQFRKCSLAVETFLQSLIWRAPHAFNVTEAIAYINEAVIRSEMGHRELLDALLTVATVPEHPFNAEQLHAHLAKFPMPKRDRWWQPFLQYQYGENQSVDRLVAWAWEGGDKSHLGDGPVELAAVALTWFLASSNRFLRDRATKALVALLPDRLEVVAKLVERFHSANDPYIVERVYAVAYGCTLRSPRNKTIGRLAQTVYDRVFASGYPPAHVLLRDYARGVIETALYHGAQLNIGQPFRPPYRSEWPRRIPSEKALKAKYYDRHQQCRYLWFSVAGSGDFDRYVIQPAFGHFRSRRLGAPHKPSRKERYDAFVQLLTEPQRQLWDEFQALRIGSFLRQFKKDGDNEDAAAHERHIRTAATKFTRSLTPSQKSAYRKHVLPYERGPRDELMFKTSLACRWIYQRVFTLGWTPELFGEIESVMDRGAHGREAGKPERIGKKYQWIALHELLARASDNFEMRAESRASAKAEYQGPWQLSVRDIDPSSILREGKDHSTATTRCWWMRSRYDAWATRRSDLQWLQITDDLPNVPRLLVVKDRSGNEYLLLDVFFNWEQSARSGEERYEHERRELWLMIKSYFVARKDAEKFYTWATAQNFAGRWMPESHPFYEVFLREFPWSPAFISIYTPYYSRDDWTDASRGDKRLPAKVLVTDDEYLKEFKTTDCSVDSSIHVKLPAKWIYDQMNLTATRDDGVFTDASGKVVALDPSVKEDGPGVLLMEKRALLRFLSESDCDIVWTVLGEKQLIGGRIGQGYWPGRLEISGAYRIDSRSEMTGILKRRLKRQKLADEVDEA